jgi:hypothetical protein
MLLFKLHVLICVRRYVYGLRVHSVATKRMGRGRSLPIMKFLQGPTTPRSETLRFCLGIMRQAKKAPAIRNRACSFGFCFLVCIILTALKLLRRGLNHTLFIVSFIFKTNTHEASDYQTRLGANLLTAVCVIEEGHQ